MKKLMCVCLTACKIFRYREREIERKKECVNMIVFANKFVSGSCVCEREGGTHEHSPSNQTECQ